MAKWNEKGAFSVQKLQDFGGIDRMAQANDKKSAYDLNNLRRLADGSLVRRQGYTPILTLPAAVRGVFSCALEGEDCFFAAAGDKFYALSLSASGGTWTAEEIGSLNTTDGEVTFALFDGAVLAMDGGCFYRLLPHRAIVARPYVPLYGKDWASTQKGEVCEERNVLTDQIHIRYLMVGASVTLALHVDAISVETVMIDGEVAPSTWTYNDQTHTIRFESSVSEGSAVDVCMTLTAENEALRAQIYTCRQMMLPGEMGQTCALLYDGQTPTVLYGSRAVTKENREICNLVDPDACMLYFHAEDTLTPGTGLHPITAMVQHYDRTLLFTTQETLMAKNTAEMSGIPTFSSVNRSMGCSCAGGAAVVGNSPMTVFGRGILRWNSETDRPDECNAELVSLPIAQLLPDEFTQKGRCLYHRAAREIWFYLPGKAERIFVWQEDFGAFTCMSGFIPDCLFTRGDQMGFATGEVLYLFDEAAMQDTAADGSIFSVVCEFETQCFDFGHTGRDLRLGRVMICADCDAGQEICVQLHSGEGNETELTMVADDAKPCEMVRRASLGRFRHLTMRVECACQGEFRLRAVGVAAIC